MSELAIRQCFETRLKAWAEQEGLCVRWENKGEKPASGEYIDTKLLPAGQSPDDLTGEVTRHTGLYSMNVFTPPGTGAARAGHFIDQLRLLFPTFAYLDGGTLKVFLSAPLNVGPAQPDENAYMVPTSLQYLALA